MRAPVDIWLDNFDNELAAFDKLLAELCAGRSILDLFCYSGGFAISAAVAGASGCVGVDSSAFALELARENAELNGLGSTCEFVQADVHRYLKGPRAGERDERSGGKSAGGGVTDCFDVVVCDPPKLAPSIKDLPRAPARCRPAPPRPCGVGSASHARGSPSHGCHAWSQARRASTASSTARPRA